jgi:hypothetical protein
LWYPNAHLLEKIFKLIKKMFFSTKKPKFEQYVTHDILKKKLKKETNCDLKTRKEEKDYNTTI